jgi:hypothetical protein
MGELQRHAFDLQLPHDVQDVALLVLGEGVEPLAELVGEEDLDQLAIPHVEYTS